MRHWLLSLHDSLRMPMIDLDDLRCDHCCAFSDTCGDCVGHLIAAWGRESSENSGLWEQNRLERRLKKRLADFLESEGYDVDEIPDAVSTLQCDHDGMPVYHAPSDTTKCPKCGVRLL